jgi:hypothetical protein
MNGMTGEVMSLAFLGMAMVSTFLMANYFFQRRLNTVKESLNASLETKEKEVEGKLMAVIEEKETLVKDLAFLKSQEAARLTEYENRILQLNQLLKMTEDERVRRLQEAEQLEANRLLEMKKTWSRHETDVEEKLKLVCQRLNVLYIDKEKFPLGGKPDNAIKICDEYVIFDSKSPANSDDLSNFPTYIRNQADGAKKYAKHDGVKKDIFLVVPLNAISSLDETYLSLAEWRRSERISNKPAMAAAAHKPVHVQMKKPRKADTNCQAGFLGEADPFATIACAMARVASDSPTKVKTLRFRKASIMG